MSFEIKRVYETVADNDGQRVLVDRLWPRGLKKTDAHLTLWMKEVAPSDALRRWFDHDPAKFSEFGSRYRKELAGAAALDTLRRLGKDDKVTLLYAAHDPKVNHATVLLSVLRGRTRAAPAAKTKK
jgi:uncharacterized protein YeaO (DUF488 family)